VKKLLGKPKAPIYYGYIVALAAFVGMVMIWGTWNTFGVFFESLVEDFSWSRAITAGATSVSSIAFGLLCIFSAYLSERFSPRIIITLCGLILGLSYILMSQITSLWHLYLYFGILVALGMSAYVPLLTLVAKWFSRRRSTMTGVVLSGMGLGTMLLPPMASYLISNYQWQTSYIAMGIVTMVIMVIAAQFVRNVTVKVKESNGFNYDQTRGTYDGIAFKKALGTKQFAIVCGLYFSFLFCVLSITVHIVIHATGLGLSQAESANILAIIGGFLIVGLNLAGILADKIGIKLLLIASYVLLTLSLTLLLFANTVWTIYVSAALFGLAYGGMQVLLSPLVAYLFGLRSHGTILGTVQFAGTIGAAIGPVVAGYLFDILQNYTAAFVLCIIIAFAGVILALAIKPIYQHSPYTQ